MMILRNFGIVPPVPPPATKFFNVDTQIHNPQSVSSLTICGTISYPLITNGSPFLGIGTLTIYKKVLVLEYNNHSDTSPNRPGLPDIHVHIHCFHTQFISLVQPHALT